MHRGDCDVPRMEAKDGYELESRLLLRNDHGLLIVRLLAEDTAYLVEVVSCPCPVLCICVELRPFLRQTFSLGPLLHNDT